MSSRPKKGIFKQTDSLFVYCVDDHACNLQRSGIFCRNIYHYSQLARKSVTGMVRKVLRKSKCSIFSKVHNLVAGNGTEFWPIYSDCITIPCTEGLQCLANEIEIEIVRLLLAVAAPWDCWIAVWHKRCHNPICQTICLLSVVSASRLSLCNEYRQ